MSLIHENPPREPHPGAASSSTPGSGAAREQQPTSVQHALERLFAHESLSEREVQDVFTAIVAGGVADAELAAFLVALRMKGETVHEIAGAARALRAAAEPFPRPDYMFVDTCGTGGDGAHTINLSTAVAFVAAAAGLPVAKHGNRSVSSACGSADVLEQMGVRIDPPADVARRALDEVGFCFLFAPQYHPGLKNAGPVRRALKVRTIMNMIGPLANPARPPVQVMGVADPRFIEPAAHALALLGCERAMVLHGSGLDEAALHGTTQAALLSNGEVRTLSFTPEDAGLEPSPLSELRGGDAKENAERLLLLLKGRGGKADRDATALNAGALLFVAGRTEDLRAGVALAASTLSSGAPFERLQAYIGLSHG
jgi:anthranilate phosphoribosyltransferase